VSRSIETALAQCGASLGALSAVLRTHLQDLAQSLLATVALALAVHFVISD